MPQNYTDDCFAAGHVGQTDLQNIENNHACHKSSFSGATGPANTVAGMPWYDTTKNIPRFRDSGDANWLCLLPGDINQKIWIYRNDTVEGMVVDSSVTDRVIAIKGGSQAYNVNGGNVGGSFTISGINNESSHTHGVGSYAIPNHNHKWYENNAVSADDQSYNSGGSVVDLLQGTTKVGNQKHIRWYDGAFNSLGDCWTNNAGAGSVTGTSAAGSAHKHGHSGTDRPAAAVGTLQKPDL